MSFEQFPITSRYNGVETTEIETADGSTVVYLKRRFIPSPDRFDLLHEHEVTEGDRLDRITTLHLGDPEQYWRICDANNAMRPDDLTKEIARRLRITLPEGIPGHQRA
jgi:hypothetical protein